MSVTFAQLNKIINTCSKHYPTLLRSRHGVGKSEFVRQFAESLGLNTIERRVSQMTEGDCLGLPQLRDGATHWLPPAWLKTSCDMPVVLFLDELDRGTREVRQCMFELCDSRKIAGHSLHPDTRVFAAINGSDKVNDYQVDNLDPAELDRWTCFDLDPTVEDWLLWAKDKIHNLVYTFIQNHHDHLEHKDAFEPGKVYPSRRSWVRFSIMLKDLGEGEELKGKVDEILFLCTATVGEEAAIAFTKYVNNYEFAVKPEDVLVKGKWSKKWTITEQMEIIDKMRQDGWWSIDKKIKDDKAILKNAEKFFCNVYEEAAWKIFTDIAQEAKNIDLIRELKGLKKFKEKLSEIATKIYEDGKKIKEQEK